MNPAAADSKPICARLFDFQVNGFAGVDFQQDSLTLGQLRCAVGGLRQHQVAGIFLTLITDGIDALCRRFARIEHFCRVDESVGSMIPGYHLEGPWLRPEIGFCGAHPIAPMVAPRLADFDRLQAAAGDRIRLVTLAPEWPGSAEFIRALTSRGVHVSLGHTNASATEIDAAISAGARFCTHLGNGTPLLLPRHDNITQRLLARDELTVCLIPDGVHLPPFVLRNFFRAKPAGRALFTTDAMAGAGATPGRHTLGALSVDIGADGIARHAQSGSFAGSTLTPDQGVRNIAAFLSLPLEESTRLWSDAAAAAFGIPLNTASHRTPL